MVIPALRPKYPEIIIKVGGNDNLFTVVSKALKKMKRKGVQQSVRRLFIQDLALLEEVIEAWRVVEAWVTLVDKKTGKEWSPMVPGQVFEVKEE